MNSLDKQLIEAREAYVLILSRKLRNQASQWSIPEMPQSANAGQWDDWRRDWWEIQSTVTELARMMGG